MRIKARRRVKWIRSARRVLMMGKARRHTGMLGTYQSWVGRVDARACKARNLADSNQPYMQYYVETS